MLLHDYFWLLNVSFDVNSADHTGVNTILLLLTGFIIKFLSHLCV